MPEDNYWGMSCLFDTCFFYKHIKIQGLGSDMLKATQYTG